MTPSESVQVAISIAESAADLGLPEYATDLSAGMDLRAAVEQDTVLEPGCRALIPTGIHIGLPPGYEAQVRPRSGLAIKHGLALLNSPGTIDADYRGEVKVILANLGAEPVTIARGQRIAQMVVAPVSRVEWKICTQLDETGRGAGGFGSTGS